MVYVIKSWFIWFLELGFFVAVVGNLIKCYISQIIYIYIYTHTHTHTHTHIHTHMGSYIYMYMGSPGGSPVKNLLANTGDVGSISGSTISPGEGNDNSFQHS